MNKIHALQKKSRPTTRKKCDPWENCERCCGCCDWFPAEELICSEIANRLFCQRCISLGEDRTGACADCD